MKKKIDVKNGKQKGVIRGNIGSCPQVPVVKSIGACKRIPIESTKN